MKILKSYKFRLTPTKDQIAMLQWHGGNARFVWNKLLEYSKKNKEETNKYPSQSLFQKKIINLKAENDFIKISHSQPIQFNALKLTRTYTRAFSPEVVAERNIKISEAYKIEDEEKKNKALAKALDYGFPKFKKKSDMNDSLFYPQNFILKKTRVHLPKLGWISYIKHREIEGKAKFVTITQDGNQYYISVTSELEIKEKVKINIDQANIIGADVGLKTFATLSDSSVIENPRTLKKYLKKLRRMNRKLARQSLEETKEKSISGKAIKKSSNRRDKQVIRLQVLHRKIRNIRKDFLHKTTHYIINKYDGVILETLDIKQMLQNNGKAMNRSICDVSWYEFGRILEYKSLWNSKYFIKIDQYFPSTQKCNKCGNLSKLSLKQREYICPNCGNVCGRDPNASLNVKDEGIRLLKENNNKNTVAATEINACGPTALAVGMKREKRRFQQPLEIKVVA